MPGRRQAVAAVRTHGYPLSDSGRADALSVMLFNAAMPESLASQPVLLVLLLPAGAFESNPLAAHAASLRPLASFSVTLGRRCHRNGHFICAQDTDTDQFSYYWCLPARPRPCSSESIAKGDAPAGYLNFFDVCLGMRPPGAPHQLAPDGRRTWTATADGDGARTTRTRIFRTSEAEKHARHGQAAAFARGDVP